MNFAPPAPPKKRGNFRTVQAYDGLYPPSASFGSKTLTKDLASAYTHNRAKPYLVPDWGVEARIPRPPLLPKAPEAENWAKTIAAASIDVLASRRDARSLKRWLTPGCFEQLQHGQHLEVAARGSPARPVNARLFKVDERTVEFAVTVWDQGRLRAVAGRLEKLRHRWLTTALTIG